jgi:hypothetical protein
VKGVILDVADDNWDNMVISSDLSLGAAGRLS